MPSDHLYFGGDVKLECECSYSEIAGTYQIMQVRQQPAVRTDNSTLQNIQFHGNIA